MPSISSFLIGFLIGSIVGIFSMALIESARRGDKYDWTEIRKRTFTYECGGQTLQGGNLDDFTY